MTLVSAIIEATERSMPPAMTTMVCAATAKAIGQNRAHQRSEVAGAVVRLDDLGEDEQQREQHEQARIPSPCGG